MSAPAAYRAPVLRTVLALVAVGDLLSLLWFIADARARLLAGGLTPGVLTDLVSRPPVAAAVAAVGIAGAAAFARRPGRLGAGLLPLVALIVLSSVHGELFGTPWRHLYFSGACLSGWLLGLAFVRRSPSPTDESYARMGGLALLGAAYLNSGISKLAYGGGEWMSGYPIQAVILGQSGLPADDPISPYRHWVVATPAAAQACAVGTAVFELAGPLMIAGRRLRLLVMIGLLVMHTIIFLLTPVLYWESMVLLLAFGLSAEPPPGAAAAAGAASRLADGRTFARGAALLALAAIIAIAYQSWRAAPSPGGAPEADRLPPPAAGAAAVEPR